MLGRLLSLPVLGPIDGVLWLARLVEDQAKGELWDEGKIVGSLTELELKLDLGEIGLEEYEAQEADLLERLKQIREAKKDG